MIKHIKKRFFALCMTALLGVELFGTPVRAEAAGDKNPTQASEMVAVNATNFPDANLRASVKEQWDIDGDGYVNALEVNQLNCSYRGVKSLKGIEKFKNLTFLAAEGNDISGTVSFGSMPEIAQLYLDNPVNCTYDLTGTYFQKHTGSDGRYYITLYVKQSGEVIDFSHIKNAHPDRYKGEKADYKNKKYKTTLRHCEGLNDITDYFYDGVGSFGIQALNDTDSLSEVNNNFWREGIACGYKTHVQTYGDQDWVLNGKTAGTTGKAKRLESIRIQLSDYRLGVQYTTHVQTYGWQPWVSDGEMSGTEGEAKRLEAIKIRLTGDLSSQYDIYYRVHAQSYGWLGWAKNGEPAGTAGYAKRLEGIQIKVVRKGSAFDKNQDGVPNSTKAAYYSKSGETNVTVSGEDTPTILYQTHVQSYGWQGWKSNGTVAGTVGKGKRLEGIRIRYSNYRKGGSGISYKTHVQSYGWEKESHYGGDVSGTVGKAKRLEAIEINLHGTIAEEYDVYYRVHAQTYGWLGWVKNGAPAGTEGLAKRLEGIQIILVKKGDPAPANNYKGVVSTQKSGFIKK